MSNDENEMSVDTSTYEVNATDLRLRATQSAAGGEDLTGPKKSQRSKGDKRPNEIEAKQDVESSESEDVIDPRTPMIMDTADGAAIRSPSRDGLAPQNKQLYARVYLVTQAVGLLLLVSMFVWITRYLGGFGFDTPAIVFNWHPAFMLLGFIFIYGNSILIYRTFRGEMKPKLKLAHAIGNGVTIGVCLFGSLAVLYFHHKANIPHFYSLHSWLGGATWTLFLGQFAAGFAAFLFPGASYAMRSTLMPFHRFLGTATFVLAAATCLTGLNEKAIFAFNGKNGSPSYSAMTGAGVMTNVIGLVLVAYASLVVYLVTKPDFKRNPLPEEQNVTFPKRTNQL